MRRALDLLFSPSLPLFRGPDIHCFRAFWPCTGCVRFMICGHFGHFPEGTTSIIPGPFGGFHSAVDSFFRAISAVFGERYIYEFLPCWPLWERGASIIFNRFGSFRRLVSLLFSAILTGFGSRSMYWIRRSCQFSEGGRFIIFDHLGIFRRAVASLSAPILALFVGHYICHFRPFGPFSKSR